MTLTVAAISEGQMEGTAKALYSVSWDGSGICVPGEIRRDLGVFFCGEDGFLFM